MELNTNPAVQRTGLRGQEGAVRNERFVGECLKKIRAATDAGQGLRCLLEHLGKSLECERVYVFEEMDRQHVSNTCEWCGEGILSGIEQLPYVAKKDLFPWYERLETGENIIETHVEILKWSEPLIYGFLQPQGIRSIILSPLFLEGRMTGFLGADNPPPEKMEHISALFDVLAYFVCSLVSQRELQRLREEQIARKKPTPDVGRYSGKTVLLVDDSRELLKCNERVLRPEGYTIRTAATLKEAGKILEQIRPDAIVMDIDLTDGSGLDFCRELRRHVDIPVIFLTARSDAQAAKEGIAAGSSAFLTKPYQLEELQAAVADAVEGEKCRAEQTVLLRL